MSSDTEVLTQVRRVLDQQYPAEETIHTIRQLLDAPRQQQPIEHTDRGWPVLRPSEAIARPWAHPDNPAVP